MRPRPKTTVPPLPQADFDALPLSVQRKYFSSLERLQIRQHSLDSQSHHAHAHAHASTPSLSDHVHRCPSLTRDRSTNPLHLHHHPHHNHHRHPVSQEQVDFFLALPDKLRKLYFSRDEQAALLAKCRHSLLSADNNCERAQQRFSDFHFDFKNGPDSISNRSYADSDSELISPLLSRDVSLVSPRGTSYGPFAQDLDPSRDSQSSLLYLDIMAPSFPRNATPRENVRRTMSLSTTSGHHSNYSSASAVLMAPSGFAIAPPVHTPSAPTHQRAHSSSVAAGRRSSHAPTPPVFDPEAAHYRDPEARKKLRTYLASPQKFDEAIEFGFPSNPDDDTVTPHYQLPPITSHARKFSKDMQNFLREGKLSFFEDKNHENQGLDSDRDSVPDMESPTTPSSLSFRLHSRRVSHSKFSTEESSPPAGLLNREMTLRMTLTRPDLRADDDQLYGWQSASSPKVSKDDPLALEDLVLTDDMTGTQGAFYVKPKPRGNLVTRMLKRASLKGR